MFTYSPGRRTEVRVPNWFPEAYEGLGERIRDARESQGMSQRDLCEAVGLYRPQLSRYENGHSVPSVLVLAAMALHLNTNLDWIVYGRGFSEVPR
jgi:transcriptional regulator with XRE-family HTH domain